MLENLIFSLNGTMPLFLLMLLGYILKRVNFLTDGFIKIANKFVFNITLPILLFRDLAQVDILADFDVNYVLFCAITTTISIVVIWFLAKLAIKDKTLVGEFVQGAYRSSAAVLGAAFIQNIYGSSAMSGLMIIGCVPLYNIFAVMILILESPNKPQDVTQWRSIQKSLIGILTNPIIIGVFFGTLTGCLRLNMPIMIDKTMSGLANLTTPLALIAIGAGFSANGAQTHIKLASIATTIKLLVLPAIILPIAVYYGYTHEKLVALIVMLGSITTPASYIMAKNMGHDGTLTASICVYTTIFSAFTLTLWLFIFKSVGVL